MGLLGISEKAFAFLLLAFPNPLSFFPSPFYLNVDVVAGAVAATQERPRE